jgi:hypothetical protein
MEVLFMIKSPFGIILAAGAVILAMNPEARKALRQLAVKGTAAVLDIADQIKERTEVVTKKDNR